MACPLELWRFICMTYVILLIVIVTECHLSSMDFTRPDLLNSTTVEPLMENYSGAQPVPDNVSQTDMMTETHDGEKRKQRVPDEQRLYERLMMGYESSVRPVMNASRTILVSFKLTLNQIIDLDERKQVLTTNVFIDQTWEDENLKWNMDEYNGIKSLRVPAAYVWLPDTFIFNNADDGSTGFMQGVYVSLNWTGTVLWPVPVKLKSSCKVDITYFPFDDQKCILRFGSWIYSGEWMDFESSIQDVDLRYYIDNSEWELLSISFKKGVRKYACCSEPHPDLTYTLHIRRRTFFYIFNIIVPCIMLSVLTLLTFWLPTTCGEKISLGLSVFLAFSMFMLLIAEEVPATSESVPLIGIYLTTVMTMTSLSVVMAVLVINVYNRGSKARRAPKWLKVVVLDWICKMLRMSHDIDRLAQTIKLSGEEEARYNCEPHSYQRLQGQMSEQTRQCQDDPLLNMKGSPSMAFSASESDLDDLSKRFTKLDPGATFQPHTSNSYNSPHEALVQRTRNGRQPSVSGVQNAGMSSSDDPDHALVEPVWLPRDKSAPSGISTEQERCKIHDEFKETNNRSRPVYIADDETGFLTGNEEDYSSATEGASAAASAMSAAEHRWRKQQTISNHIIDSCQKEMALMSRKEMVVEWQTIATVVDRLLFWIFLLGTIVAYIVILIIIPGSKPTLEDGVLPADLIKRSS